MGAESQAGMQLSDFSAPKEPSCSAHTQHQLASIRMPLKPCIFCCGNEDELSTVLQLPFLKVGHKVWKNKTSRAILVVFPTEDRTIAEATEAFSHTENESTQHRTPRGHSQMLYSTTEAAH